MGVIIYNVHPKRGYTPPNGVRMALEGRVYGVILTL